MFDLNKCLIMQLDMLNRWLIAAKLEETKKPFGPSGSPKQAGLPSGSGLGLADGWTAGHLGLSRRCLSDEDDGRHCD